MRSTILESTPIYQLDRKQGLEETLAKPTPAWTPIESVSIIQINRIRNSIYNSDNNFVKFWSSGQAWLLDAVILMVVNICKSQV